MSSAEYRFLTTWQIGAPREQVWDAILHVERWRAWWRGLERVEQRASGDVDRLGARYRLTWKGRLPYRLVVEMTTVHLRPCRLLESQARGELEGRGVWRLWPNGAGTRVDYEWRVRTVKRWMNIVAPLLHPLFSWNHDVVMRRGERGLKRLLEETPQRRRR